VPEEKAVELAMKAVDAKLRRWEETLARKRTALARGMCGSHQGCFAGNVRIC
jgi:hypothetical protein